MKKIITLLSFLFMMFLWGCSEQPEYTTLVDFEEQIQYDFTTVKFNRIDRDDLMNYLIDEASDLEFMLLEATNQNQNETLGESLNGVIDTLSFLSKRANVSFGDLLNYSASELNTLATESDVSLTVDDIVGFYDLVQVLSELDATISISKVDYVELKLGRDLTSTEITALTDLQYAYSTLRWYRDFDITEKTFLEIVDDLDGINYEATQSDYDSMEIGYDLLMSIINID